MVGGGTQSALLCQFTANACGCRVSAGPIEATVLGNIALQLMASGDIKSIEEAREIIKRSQDIKIYEPQDKEAWDELRGNGLPVVIIMAGNVIKKNSSETLDCQSAV